MAERTRRKWAVTSVKRWRFHLVRGARCLEVGDFAGARRHFAAAFLEAPDQPIVCLAWARELLRAGDVDSAEPLLRRAWTSEPTLVSAGFSLARLLGLHRGQRGEAKEILDEIEQHEGTSAALLLVRAELAVTDPALHEEAKALFDMARRHGADELIVRAGLAKAYNAEGVFCSRAGEHHQALFALKHAADLDPGWSGPLTNSGAVFDKLGMPQKARVHYRAALQIDPTNPVALFNLADSLRRAGSYAEASRLYRRLLSFKPDYPGARAAIQKIARSRKGGGREVSKEPPPGPVKRG